MSWLSFLGFAEHTTDDIADITNGNKDKEPVKDGKHKKRHTDGDKRKQDGNPRPSHKTRKGGGGKRGGRS